MSDDIEQGLIDAYMDDPRGHGPTDATRKAFLHGRLRSVKQEYETLIMLREEAAAKKDDKRIAEFALAFRDNYKARKYAITQLRQMGEEVEDPFVPLSAVK